MHLCAYCFTFYTINILSLLFKYSEEKIINKLKERDQKCFADVYDEYSGAVYGIIFRMIQNTELAEKVLLETFIEVLENVENYDSEKERTFTWIAKIARHKSMEIGNNYRAIPKNLKNNQPLNREKSIMDDDACIVSLLPGQQGCCPENDQKQIIDLSYFECFTVNEISKRLLIPPEAVKIKLRMSIMELRKSG